MCRSIKPLFNFDPVATDEEIQAAALQFVRKVSGYKSPTQLNEQVFNKAVLEISRSTRSLINSLQTSAPPKDREVEKEKRRKRAAKRFGQD